MQQILISICLVLLLFVDVSIAADQTRKKEASVAKEKAAVLEEMASANSGDTSPLPEPDETITRLQARAVDPTGDEPLDDAITCLARSIYWEANRTDNAEMEAIANVVINRLGHAGFPNTICGVVKQGQEQGACQFSWWCDGRPDAAQEEAVYTRAKEIARKALNQQLKDSTDGAMYFHNKKVTPDWSKEYIRTVEVGEHIFYKPTDDKAK
ncbi:cell wall hydrolase [Nitrosomonas supralitoralis]|uniref:Cell wall hydrolase n=1 Tax=Nitrosomonas supralitoralis TaxID=2116706 RepID=A0A2P7NU02_9PROT|nr:cell wall hydrolase [Nitrosomonas supralitoralis]